MAHIAGVPDRRAASQRIAGFSASALRVSIYGRFGGGACLPVAISDRAIRYDPVDRERDGFLCGRRHFGIVWRRECGSDHQPAFVGANAPLGTLFVQMVGASTAWRSASGSAACCSMQRARIRPRLSLPLRSAISGALALGLPRHREGADAGAAVGAGVTVPLARHCRRGGKHLRGMVCCGSQRAIASRSRSCRRGDGRKNSPGGARIMRKTWPAVMAGNSVGSAEGRRVPRISVQGLAS